MPMRAWKSIPDPVRNLTSSEAAFRRLLKSSHAILELHVEHQAQYGKKVPRMMCSMNRVEILTSNVNMSIVYMTLTLWHTDL